MLLFGLSLSLSYADVTAQLSMSSIFMHLRTLLFYVGIFCFLLLQHQSGVCRTDEFRMGGLHPSRQQERL